MAATSRRTRPEPKTPATIGGLVGPEAIADTLGVTAEYMRRLAREGRIPSVKVGKYVRFNPAEIAAWVAANHRDAAVS